MTYVSFPEKPLKYANRNGTQAVPYSYSFYKDSFSGCLIHFETAPF